MNYFLQNKLLGAFALLFLFGCGGGGGGCCKHGTKVQTECGDACGNDGVNGEGIKVVDGCKVVGQRFEVRRRCAEIRQALAQVVC